MNLNQLEVVRKAVEKFPTDFCGLIPFSREITGTDLSRKDYIPYGSTLLTTLGLEYEWEGLHFDLSKFNYQAALDNRDDMLNSAPMRLDAAINYLSEMIPDAEVFVRPSEDLKQFSGQTISAIDAHDWFKSMMECQTSGSYKLDPDTMVVVSEPKNIAAEWRYFIVGGEVVSGSIYRLRNQLRSIYETDTAVLSEARGFANKWLPDQCCVMDLALLSDDSVKVIEFNCINASGFYANDVPIVFDALWEYHKEK